VPWRSPRTSGTHVDPAEKKKTGMERLDRITVDVARLSQLSGSCVLEGKIFVRNVRFWPQRGCLSSDGAWNPSGASQEVCVPELVL
jgi:hypothetical protein